MIKIKNILQGSLVILLGATLTVGTAHASNKEQAKLEARAKITKTEAQKTALTKVPGGVVKEAELEEENGKLVWSFDISRPGTKNITEIQVDAVTGKIILTEIETPAQQKKEAQGDAPKEKKAK